MTCCPDRKWSKCKNECKEGLRELLQVQGNLASISAGTFAGIISAGTFAGIISAGTFATGPTTAETGPKVSNPKNQAIKES